MNKKIISFLLALLMVSSAVLSSCDKDDTDKPSDTTVGSGETPNEQEDNFAGTPAYTVDGDYIVVDGVKYPNKNNFNCGPLLAMDDLDRELPTAEQTMNAVTDGSKNVGIFYFLWMGEHGDVKGEVYDINKIVETGGKLALFPSYDGWGDHGDMHFWGEPLYGYYYSKDEWVIRRHMEELTNAGVDFLYFDATNGYPYSNNAKKVMRVLSQMNDEGWNAPKVVFYTNTDSGLTISKIFNEIYKKEYCKDTWYMLDGKPVIIGKESEAKSKLGADKDFFTYKSSQWPNERKTLNAWPWMSFFQWDEGKPSYNERAGDGEVFLDNDGNKDAISVSVAQHCGTVRFSDSALYKDRTNHGRSYHNGRYFNEENSYLYGYNFQEQWDRAIAESPKNVLVTGWNEWVAQRQPDDKNRVVFVDTCTTEFSRDIEPMRGGYFDNYYMQLTSNIRKYKGTAPTLVQNTRKKIDVNGSFDQWNDVLVTYSDVSGETEDRKSTVFGKERVEDTTGRNDLVKMKVIYDTKNAYFYAECKENISAADANSTWMQLFINIDNAKSGWYGYDYIVNYKSSGATETSLAKFNTDGKFELTEVSKITYKVEGNKMMIAVPLADLGITDFNDINFSFKWADSDETINTMEQMYTSGDQAPHGRYNFVFQNHK